MSKKSKQTPLWPSQPPKPVAPTSRGGWGWGWGWGKDDGGDRTGYGYSSGPSSFGGPGWNIRTRASLDLEDPTTPYLRELACLKEAAEDVIDRRPDLRADLARVKLRFGPEVSALFDLLAANDQIQNPADLLAMCDSESIYLNDSFFHAPPVKRALVLAHEAAHVAFRHPNRFRQLSEWGSYESRRRPDGTFDWSAPKGKPEEICPCCANRAADWIVQRLLTTDGWTKGEAARMEAAMPETDEEVAMLEHADLESLYRALHERHEQEQPPPPQPQPQAGGESESESDSGEGEGEGCEGDGQSQSSSPGQPLRGKCPKCKGHHGNANGDPPPAPQRFDSLGTSRQQRAAMDKAGRRADERMQQVPGLGSSLEFGDLVTSKVDEQDKSRVSEIAQEVSRWVINRAQAGAGQFQSIRPSRRLGGTGRDGVLFPFAQRPRPVVAIGVDVSGSVSGSPVARNAIFQTAQAVVAACESAGADVVSFAWANTGGMLDPVTCPGGWANPDAWRYIPNVGGGTDLDGALLWLAARAAGFRFPQRDWMSCVALDGYPGLEDGLNPYQKRPKAAVPCDPLALTAVVILSDGDVARPDTLPLAYATGDLDCLTAAAASWGWSTPSRPTTNRTRARWGDEVTQAPQLIDAKGLCIVTGGETAGCWSLIAHRDELIEAGVLYLTGAW